jgi:hypothetical protein
VRKAQCRSAGGVLAGEQNARAEQRVRQHRLRRLCRDIGLRDVPQRQGFAVARRFGQSPQQPRQGIERSRRQIHYRALRLRRNGPL